MKISVISVVKNEAEHIARWAQSVLSYADDVVVGLLESVDSTEEELKKFPTIQVIKFSKDFTLAHGYSYPKNLLTQHAEGDWLVYLDADEQLEVTRAQLLSAIKKAEIQGKTAITTNTYHFAGDPHLPIETRQRVFDQKHWRICKNNIGFRWYGIVHEYLKWYGQDVQHYAMDSSVEMTHFSPLPDPLDPGITAELMCRTYDIGSIAMPGSRWWFRGDNYARLRAAQQNFWQSRSAEFFPYRGQTGSPYATHLPTLSKTIELFKPKRIAEYGVGEFSTPLLRQSGALVHSYESNPDWRKKFTNGGIVHDTYDGVPLIYDLVFVDHDLVSRNQAIERHKNAIIVVHDTEDQDYQFHLTLSNFRYVYTDVTLVPWTTVASNHVDVTQLGPGVPHYVPVHSGFV